MLCTLRRHCVRKTHSCAVAAETSHSGRVVDEHLHVAGAASGIASATAARGQHRETQIDGTSGRYLNHPATREAGRHRAGVVGTGECAVYVTQRSSAAFTTNKPLASYTHTEPRREAKIQGGPEK